MEVILAKTAGFCFGVKKAVDPVYNEADKGGRIYTFGPIIHNEEVIRDLGSKGVEVIEDEDDIDDISGGTVIIRSHGVEEKIYDRIEKRGLRLIDATCPFVKKIHGIVLRESNSGRQVIIIGSDDHPEVMGIMGWCKKTPAIVIKNEDEAWRADIAKDRPLCIVSQTTFNHDKFQDLVDIFNKRGYDVNVVDTICNATMERQTEAERLARSVDAMIVIGGRLSSNTQKLYEICRRVLKNTQYIQTIDDLDSAMLEGANCVGITAGASTPNNIIEEVQNYVRINF